MLGLVDHVCSQKSSLLHFDRIFFMIFLLFFLKIKSLIAIIEILHEQFNITPVARLGPIIDQLCFLIT